MFTETESIILQQDFTPLDAEKIRSQLIGKTFIGRFPPLFCFIVSILQDGSLAGKNNHQHYDTGKWVINDKSNTLSVIWDFGWVSSVNRVYDVNGVFKLFDASSGKLNTILEKSIKPVSSIQEFNIDKIND